MRRQKESAASRDVDVLSFIIKLQPELPDEESRERLLRGTITHVPSGERRSVKSLEGIADFIIPYLEMVQVRLGVYWRFRRWKQDLLQRLSR